MKTSSIPPTAVDTPESLHVLEFQPNQEEATWNQICRLCPALRNGDSWGLRRLRDGLNKYVKSVVIESGYICKDHRNLHSHYYSKRFHAPESNCHRIHFFSTLLGATRKDFDLFEAIQSKEIGQGYMGYSVIRPSEFTRALGRTVIDPAKIGLGIDNNYFMLGARFRVHVAGWSLFVRGYPYISQDAEAMVCAHSALWGVCRYLSQAYNVYKELYPYDLITGTDTHAGRTVPYRGMTYSDYSDILTKFGCHPVLIHNAKMDDGDFWKMYTYIESGFPILASTDKQHVITVIGHTQERNRIPKVNRNGFARSSDFVGSFVVVDDNRFPYRELQRAAPDKKYGNMYRDKRDKRGKTDLCVKSLLNLVIPLPEKVFLTADYAWENFERYLLKGEWPAAMADVLNAHRRSKADPLITRQFVTSGSAVKRTALKRYGNSKSGIFTRIAEMPLPHFVWVLELAGLVGYRDRKCLGELIIDATANRYSHSLLFARVGGCLLVPTNARAHLSGELPNVAELPNGSAATLPPYRLYENKDVPTFQQFSHNLGSLDDVPV